MHRWLAAAALIVGISAPPAPAQVSKRVTYLGRLDTRAEYAGSWGYAAGGREYALVGEESGTIFADVTDPTNPVEVAYLTGPPSVWREIKTWSHYAYVVSEGAGAGAGLQIVDLGGLPGSISCVATYTQTFLTAHTLWIDENGWLYVNGAKTAAGAFAGMRILSLADPENPVDVGAYTTRYVHDIYVRGDVGYAAEIQDDRVTILDLSDRAAPSIITSFANPLGVTHNTWLSEDGRYLGVTAETPGGFLSLYDVSDPLSPVEISEFSGPNLQAPRTFIHNIRMKGELGVASWYTEGFRVIDLSDPTLPVEVGYYDTFGGPSGGFHGDWDVYPYLPSGTIIASDIENGLILAAFNDQYGILAGTVRDAVTGLPVDGASVQVLGGGSTATSQAGGRYGVDADPGPVQIAAIAFGYHAAVVTAVAPLRSRAALDILLAPLPSGSISGTVKMPHGGALPGVTMALSGTPLTTTTDADGAYSFPSVPRGGYSLVASKQGLTPASLSVAVAPGSTLTANLTLLPAPVDEDMESDPGWTAGLPSDTATEGIWTRADPVGSGGGLVQPEDDRTPDPAAQAFITGQGVAGQGIGVNDVDGGHTTLTTSTIDISFFQHPAVSYFRWFVNDAGPVTGPDPWRVEASPDGGQSWFPFEVTMQSAAAWVPVSRSLRAVLPPLSASLTLRFIASDDEPPPPPGPGAIGAMHDEPMGGPTVVEAGIDDFQILDTCDARSLPGLPDADGDGVEDSCDPCPLDPLDDADGDGWCGDADNAPRDFNPSQADDDIDGAGDVSDNCPFLANADQKDLDGDALGDACDDDDDGDGIPDLVDPDADGDGAPDPGDNCPGITNPDQDDRDGDSIGDACDADDGLVNGLTIDSGALGAAALSWQAEAGDGTYNLYRTVVDGPGTVAEASCLRPSVPGTRWGDPLVPPPGAAFAYLATPIAGGVEGSPGYSSSGSERIILSRCR